MTESLLDRFVNRYGRLPTETDPDYLEMLRMSKYRTMPVPDQQPGKCANCGSSKPDGRSYVDFGLLIPWYGTVFLCSLCLDDIARNVGLFDELEAETTTARNELIDLKFNILKTGAELRDTLATGFKEVTSYFDELRARGYNIAPSGDLSVESSKESSKPATGESNRTVDAAKLRAAKSASGSGPKDLLSLAERLKSGS